jgi:hypothetical protein
MKPLVHVNDIPLQWIYREKESVCVLPLVIDVRLETRQKTCPEWTQV